MRPLEDDLVGQTEIARRLGVPADTVRKWSQQGKLPKPDYRVPAQWNGRPYWDWSTVEDVAQMLAQRYISLNVKPPHSRSSLNVKP